VFYQLFVFALVVGLGSPDYRAREACQRSIVRLNNAWDMRGGLRPFLAHPDPEVAARVRRVLDEYNCVFDGLEEIPRLDSFVSDFSRDVCQRLLEMSGGYVGEWVVTPLPDDVARQGTADYIAELLSRGMCRREVRVLIDQAVKVEQERYPPTPPMPREVKP
jgi:hypothetical protein